MINADKQGEVVQKQTLVWAHPCLHVQPCGTMLAPTAGSAAGEVREPHHLGQGTETNDVGAELLRLRESTAQRKGTEKGNQLLRNQLGS